MEYLLYFLFLITVVILFCYYIQIQKKNKQIKEQEQKNRELELDNVSLKSDLGNLKNNQQQVLENNQKMSLDFETKFQNIANKIFDSKNDNLLKHNKNQIDGLLTPLKDNIEVIKKQSIIDSENIQNYGRGFENLTKALKGNKQQQGNWGEMFLENILQDSGFEENRDYLKQKNFTNENGIIVRPDFIIKLPNDKQIVADSKVTLNSYQNFINSENEEEKEKYLKEYFSLVTNNIKDLSSKNYEKIPEINSLDYIFMFIPIESAFNLLIQKNMNIWERAQKEKIIIVGPLMLMVLLKSIYNIWNLEKQNKNALKIAEEGSRLYDKFVGFKESFDKIRANLESSLSSHSKATNQLYEGKGNIIDRVNKLKELGITSKKQLPEN